MKQANAGVSIMIMLVVIMIITALGATMLFEKYSVIQGKTNVERQGILDTVKTEIEVDNIVAEGSDEVKTLVITAGVSSGSEPVDMNDMLIVIEQENTTSYLQYRNGTLERDLESGYYTE